MKQFLIYCASIILPLIILFSIGEHLVRQVPNPYQYKESWMESHHKDVETLVMGGSQTFYGIKPNLIDGIVFNLANVSQGLKQDFFLINKFKCPKLKNIIIPISYPTLFSGKLEDSEEWYRAIFYKIYMDCPEHSDVSKFNFEFSNPKIFKNKLNNYFKRLRGDTIEAGYDVYGWGNKYSARKKNIKRWNNGTEAREAATRHTQENWNEALNNAKEKVGLLRKIATYCKENNINLVLITTPCWHSYVNLLDKRQLNEAHKYIRQIQNDYHVAYFDYLNDKRFKANDFYDSNHLSEMGAAKFSTILNRDIKQFQNKYNTNER